MPSSPNYNNTSPNSNVGFWQFQQILNLFLVLIEVEYSLIFFHVPRNLAYLRLRTRNHYPSLNSSLCRRCWPRSDLDGESPHMPSENPSPRICHWQAGRLGGPLFAMAIYVGPAARFVHFSRIGLSYNFCASECLPLGCLRL